MPAQRNPPHDRVTLSAQERRAFAGLVRTFFYRRKAIRRATRHDRISRARCSAVSAGVAISRGAVWLAPVGVVLVIAALLPAVALAATGGGFIAIGALAALRTPRIRARCLMRRARRR
jgi:hypothetical protein